MLAVWGQCIFQPVPRPTKALMTCFWTSASALLIKRDPKKPQVQGRTGRARSILSTTTPRRSRQRAVAVKSPRHLVLGRHCSFFYAYPSSRTCAFSRCLVTNVGCTFMYGTFSAMAPSSPHSIAFNARRITRCRSDTSSHCRNLKITNKQLTAEPHLIFGLHIVQPKPTETKGCEQNRK
jgi:hypothetical protein